VLGNETTLRGLVSLQQLLHERSDEGLLEAGGKLRIIC